MNPFKFALRRPITTLLLVVGLTAGALVAMKQLDADVVPMLDAARINSWKAEFHSLFESVATGTEATEEPHHEHHRIVATSPKSMDITITQPYVCQIHSRRHIDVCAMENGYLDEILVKEGQTVKKGDLMFRILPTLYQARYEAEVAEAQLAELEFNNTKNLAEQRVVSQNEVKLLQAKLSKAQAEVKLAKAELNFTNVIAPFDGIVDRLQEQLGSLIKEGDVLTTLSDNSLMWVYFNVPESGYLEYMAGRDRHEDDKIELVLANGNKFSQDGKIGAIEAKFNNETGNIPFRADFPNPDGLLRHGQTGTVLISRVLKDAIAIPQRATFENLAKRYVYVVDAGDEKHDEHEHDGDGDGEDGHGADGGDGHGADGGDGHEGGTSTGVVHQREIVVLNALEDIYVLKGGVLDVDEKIVLEGLREIHDGEEVEFEYRRPGEVLANSKNRAE